MEADVYRKDPRDVFGERIGLVLEGGGLRGASQPGHCLALLEAGITPVYFLGNSVGSINAALFSTARAPSEFLPILKERIIPPWDRIDAAGPKVVFPYSTKQSLERFFWKGRSFLPHDTLYRLLENFDPKKSINSPVKFEFSALKVSDKSYRVFSNHDKIFRENPPILKDAILSSACVAPIFDPIMVGGEYFDDGGFAAASRAANYGCSTVFVLYPWPEKYRKPLPPKGFIARHVREIERLRSNHAAFLRMLAQKELRIIELYNEVAERDAKLAELERELSALGAQEKELRKELLKTRLGRGEGGVAEKLLDAAGFIKNKLALFARKAAEAKRVNDAGSARTKIRIVALYSDPPPTLTLDEMRPGDIKIARERAYETTRQALRKFM